MAELDHIRAAMHQYHAKTGGLSPFSPLNSTAGSWAVYPIDCLEGQCLIAFKNDGF